MDAYEGEIPYNISLVELDEGPKIWTNVVDVPADDVHVGMRVRVRYDDVTDDLTLARFVPAGPDDSAAPRSHGRIRAGVVTGHRRG
jgi:hypothetical protein